MDFDRHEYLSSQPFLDKLTKGTLQRTVDKILNEEWETDGNLERMFINEKSTDDEIMYSSWVSQIGREIPYGNHALSFLRKNTSHSDPLVAQMTLKKVNNVIHNPEIAVEMIKMNYIPRLVKPLKSPHQGVCAEALTCIGTLSNQPLGLSAIIQNKYIVEAIRNTINYSQSVGIREQAARTVNRLVQNYFAVKTLVDAGYVKEIMQSLKKWKQLWDKAVETKLTFGQKIIAVFHFDSLEKLMEYGEAAKVEAIAHTAEQFVPILRWECVHLRRAVASFYSQVAKHQIGSEGLFCHGLIEDLCKMLIEEEDEDVKTYLATTLLFSTVHKESRKVAFKTELFEYLLNALVVNNISSAFRMRVIQILTNFAELPEGKKMLYFYFIESKATVAIKVDGSQEMSEATQTLIRTILKSP